MSLQFLKHYLITLDYITSDYIRLVTLDCITKTGSFMTCDGITLVTLDYITRIRPPSQVPS